MSQQNGLGMITTMQIHHCLVEPQKRELDKVKSIIWIKADLRLGLNIIQIDTKSICWQSGTYKWVF